MVFICFSACLYPLIKASFISAKAFVSLPASAVAKEISKKTGLSLSVAYLIIEDIQLYLSDFFRYDIELIKEKDKYFLKKIK